MLRRAPHCKPFLCALFLILLLLPLTHASAQTLAISGTAKDANGVAFVGITVGLYAGTSPNTTATTTTNGDGRFYFTGLAAGVWTVKPGKDGTMFAPPYRTYTLSTTVTDANFVGSPPIVTSSTISGAIKNSSGVAASGISVGLYLSDSLKTSATTNADGVFTFTGVAAGSYVVKPGQTGKVFDPLSRSVTAPPGTTAANFTISDATVYTISGTAKDANGVAFVGITVGLYAGTSASTTATATTNGDGRFYFTGLAPGVWTVKPGKDGTTFAPPYRTYTLSATVTDANFVGSPPIVTTSTISGLIKNSSGVAASGISVGLYLSDSLKTSATTNADGVFTFTGVATGAYVVKPVQTGKVFDPATRSVVAPPGTTAANFTISDAPLSAISGTVKDANGVAFVGVSVGLYQGTSATATSTTTTNADGVFSFTGLAAGNWTVKPGKDGTTFSPVYRTYTLPPSVTNAAFVGSPPNVVGSTISGLIKNGSGVAASGVSVGLYLGGTLKTSTTTNSEGRYTFSGVAAGAYTVLPGQSGKLFDPSYRAVTAPPGTTSANFSVSDAPTGSALAGLITNSSSVAVAGVSVGLYQSGNLKTSTVTNSEGRYYFTGLAAGAYTILPAQSGKVFDPAYRAYTVPPTVSNANFTISDAPAGSIISGVVKNDAGGVVSGISVGLYQGDSLKTSTTTNAQGRYYFTGLAAAAYVVKPGQTGKVFAPVSIPVTAPPGTTSANFTMSAAPTGSTITGLIKNPARVGVTGLSVGLYVGATLKASVTTNSEGRYTFTNVPDGRYAVKPGSDTLQFSPLYRMVVVPPSATGLDFVCAASITPPTLSAGQVSPTTGTTKTLFTFSAVYTDTANREPVYTRLSVDGTAAYTLVKADPTDTNFIDGCKYLYKLMLPVGTHKFRFAFAPSGCPVVFLPGPTETSFLSGPTVTGETYVISGLILAGTSHLQDVTVTVTADGLAPVVVTTNADGRYYATGLQPGQYTVTPTKGGYTFDPAYKTVTVPPTTSTCGFAATPQ